MTNLEWMKQEGYALRSVSVIHDRETGNILFIANKMDEYELTNSAYALYWITYDPAECTASDWEWIMSIGFADWLQSERDTTKMLDYFCLDKDK